MTGWFYFINDQQHGPVSVNELKRLAVSGHITTEVLVRKEDSDGWNEASSVRGLFASGTSTDSARPHDSFDPYHKWLGIPKKDQPPNIYRLLAIDLYESDPDVIDTAANKQMTYLHGCATGEHADIAEQLLNEISAARLCLLDVAKKVEYDRQLEQSPAEPSVETYTTPPSLPIVIEASSPTTLIVQGRRLRRKKSVRAVLAIAAIILATVSGGAWWWQSRSENQKDGSPQVGGTTDPSRSKSRPSGSSHEPIASHASSVVASHNGNNRQDEAPRSSDSSMIVEPAEAPASHASQQSTDAEKWKTLFHSSDPAIWNTSVGQPGSDHFAIPLSEAPDDVKYLKFQMDAENFVIVPITKDKLRKVTHDGTYGWQGTKNFGWGARHLGVFQVRAKPKRGEIDLRNEIGIDSKGWGFGGLWGMSGRQGYSWNGKPVSKRQFQISIATSPLLSEEEEGHLLAAKVTGSTVEAPVQKSPAGPTAIEPEEAPKQPKTPRRPRRVPKDGVFWNENWYWFSPTRLTFQQGSTLAARSSGRLVVISSDAENSFIAGKIRGPTFLGLLRVKGVWITHFGVRNRYFKWDKSQPSASSVQEKYAAIHKSGLWHDYLPDSLYICIEWGQEH